MSSPTPVQSFLGGIGLSLPVHALLLLNGNVFGISGFLHRAVRGSPEAVVAVSGLILGGAMVGLTEGAGPRLLDLSLSQVLISGFLIGLGSKAGYLSLTRTLVLTFYPHSYLMAAPLGNYDSTVNCF